MTSQQPSNADVSASKFAIIDLGSNSFHMFIAQLQDGRPVILQRVKDKVRLASGLDSHNHLNKEAMQRGWECLREFVKHLGQVPAEHRKVVATATLRLANNSDDFIQQGEAILGIPIKVITGLEEAEYIYRGATQHLDQQRHLVLDIGGASTEVIVGKGTKAAQRFSFNMGCVTFMQRYFCNTSPVQENIQDAIRAAKAILQPEQRAFIDFGWDDCFGASGTPQALNEIKGFLKDDSPITLPFLYEQAKQLQYDQANNNYVLPGMTSARQAVFPAGLAILIALFETLHVDNMQLAEGALREGLLFELANSAD